ncbi:unnamed protein product, partial [Polarella glacialis]
MLLVCVSMPVSSGRSQEWPQEGLGVQHLSGAVEAELRKLFAVQGGSGGVWGHSARAEAEAVAPDRGSSPTAADLRVRPGASLGMATEEDLDWEELGFGAKKLPWLDTSFFAGPFL